MSSKIWVFLAVTVISIGAGVAVAGIPSGRSVELAEIPTSVATDVAVSTDVPVDTDAPPATTANTASTEPDVDTTEPDTETTEPDTASTEPDVDTTEPDTTEPIETTVPETTTTVTEPATEATPTTRPPVERIQLSVAVANGASIAGVARSTADRLEATGYPDIRTLDGAETVERSVVYAAPGLQAEAEQLAVDMGIDVSLVFPLSTVPPLLGELLDEQLVVYLGIDVQQL